MCISYYVHVLHYVTEATQCNYDSLEYAFGLYHVYQIIATKQFFKICEQGVDPWLVSSQYN